MSSGVPIGAPYGLAIPNHDIRITNRCGTNCTKGQILQLDLACAEESTDNNSGHKLSGLANGINPEATANGNAGRQICVVLLEDIADNAEGTARVQGRVEAEGSDAIAIGLGLTVLAARTLGVAATDGQGIYFIALEATVDNTLTEGLWNGFGWANASA
tara:strand:+ start:12510 stop:12986 length:477 start_codon:yes stop_codon:yes gene_type:complete